MFMEFYIFLSKQIQPNMHKVWIKIHSQGSLKCVLFFKASKKTKQISGLMILIPGIWFGAFVVPKKQTIRMESY